MRNLKVMTFNLKYDFKAQDNNEWSQRCLRITKLIKDHLPDIIGTQEGL
ncbi:endonuclease, partial [Clostridium perfringens]